MAAKARTIKMNASRRSVLVGLAHHWATNVRGATVAEVVEQVAQNVQSASVSESNAYRVLLSLKRARLVERRRGGQGSWKPTRHGAVLAGNYADSGAVQLRAGVAYAVRQLAHRLDGEAERASETEQAAASLL